MCIAIGLGLGANQNRLTTIATLFILLVTSIYKWKYSTEESKNLYLSLSWTESDEHKLSAREISELVSSVSDKTDLKRHDHQGDQVQLVYFIDIESHDKVYEMVESMKARFPQVNSSFIDQRDKSRSNFLHQSLVPEISIMKIKTPATQIDRAEKMIERIKMAPSKSAKYVIGVQSLPGFQ